jgi:hypothetical protein
MVTGSLILALQVLYFQTVLEDLELLVSKVRMVVQAALVALAVLDELLFISKELL